MDGSVFEVFDEFEIAGADRAAGRFHAVVGVVGEVPVYGIAVEVFFAFEERR